MQCSSLYVSTLLLINYSVLPKQTLILGMTGGQNLGGATGHSFHSHIKGKSILKTYWADRPCIYTGENTELESL